MPTKLVSSYILFFRTSAIAVKAMFMILAARALGTTDFGEFSVFTSNLAVLLPLLGISLNQYTSRELKSEDSDQELLSDHLMAVVVTAVTILAVVPIIAGPLGVSEYIWYFVAIAFLDHLTNEAYTLLIPMGKALLANLIFFFKTIGTFGAIAVYFFVAPQNEQTLNDVFFIWLVALAILCAVLLVKFAPRKRISLGVLRSGWRVGLVYLAISLVTKSILNFDKVILSHVTHMSVVGIYGMIFSIAWTIHTLVEASLVGPAIKEFLQDKKNHGFFYQVLARSLAVYVVLWALLALSFPWIARGLGKPELMEHTILLHLFLLTGFLYTAAWAFMLRLYSLHMDRAILKTSLFALAGFMLLMFFNHVDEVAVAVNVTVSVAVFLTGLGWSFFTRQEITS